MQKNHEVVVRNRAFAGLGALIEAKNEADRKANVPANERAKIAQINAIWGTK